MAVAAKLIEDALAERAVQERDDEGWLVSERPDGRRLVVVPRMVMQLREAGLVSEVFQDTSG